MADRSAVQPGLSLTPRERDLLYRALSEHIVVVTGLPLELIKGAFDDLGWEERDDRENYELTMERGRVAHVLRALLEDLEAALEAGSRIIDPPSEYAEWMSDEDAENWRESQRRATDEALDAHAACRAVLRRLGRPDGG